MTSEANPGAGDLSGGQGVGGIHAKLDASTVAYGHLTDDKGSPAGSVPVVLYAWPNNDVMDRLVVGETANLQTVGSSTTRADGTFDLRIPVDASLAPLAGKDKLINFTIVAGEGDVIAPYSFGRTLYEQNGTYTLAEVGEGQLGEGEPVTPARPLEVSLTLNGSGSEAGSAEAERIDYNDLSPVETTAPFQKGCGTQLVADYGPRWVIVGQHYAVAHSVSADFRYTAGSSSALGVGWSKSGQYGTFSSSGTSAKSSSVTIVFPTAGHYAKMVRRTNFTYGKFKHFCIGQGGASSVFYDARPRSFAGGAQSLSGQWYPSAGWCLPYQPRSEQIMERTLALEWINGVAIASAIGVDLSARTGYSRMTAVHYKIGPYWRNLCGKYAYPAQTDRPPRVVVAHYY